MERTMARVCAMKLVYEWEMGGDGGEETLTGLLEIQPTERETGFMNALVNGVRENLAQIDELIEKYAIGWSVARITRVDLAILRVAVCEVFYMDTPRGVAIDAAVNMAKEYSTDKAGSFINGILGNLFRGEGK